MTFSNSIAQTVPGTTVLTNAGTFTGVLPTASGQVLNSTGANTYAYGSAYNSLGTGGVVQWKSVQASAFAGQNVAITVTGSTGTNYSSSALITEALFTPLYANSTIICGYQISGGCPISGANQYISINGYLTNSGAPIMSGRMGDGNNASGLLCQTAAAVSIPNSYPAQTSLFVCGFRTNGVNGANAIYNNDFVFFIEQSGNPVSPYSTLITTGTATLVMSFPIPQNSSLSVQGQFSAFNTVTEFNGNGGQFAVVVERQAGNVFFPGGSYYLSSILSLGVAPYFYPFCNTATQALEIYAVGINAQTFLFNFIFTTN